MARDGKKDKKDKQEQKPKRVKGPRVRTATQTARKMKRIETQSRRELKKRCKLAGRIEDLDNLMSKRGKGYKDESPREDPHASATTLDGLSFGTAHKRARRFARKQTLVGPPLPKRKPKSDLTAREKLVKAIDVKTNVS